MKRNTRFILAILVVIVIQIALEVVFKYVFDLTFEKIPDSFWVNYLPYIITAICFVSGATVITTKSFGIRHRGFHSTATGKTAVILGTIMIIIGILVFYINISPTVNLE